MNFKQAVEQLLVIEQTCHPVVMAFKKLRDKTQDDDWDVFFEDDNLADLLNSLTDLEFTLTEENN